jgi:ribosomal protein S18 acetylase RimI-like enzyme
MNVVRLGADHLQPYRALMLQAYDDPSDAFTSTAAERAAEPDSWWLRRLCDPSGLTAVWGALDGGALLGTVALELSGKPKTRHKGSIIGMYVLPAARGKGAGRALMAAALEHCRIRPGLAVVNLTVTEGNAPAIALYRSFGFREFGLEPKAIRGVSGYRSKVHMWLDLE